MNTHKLFNWHLWLVLLLFSGCNQEEAIMSGDGTTEEIAAAPISIRLQTRTDDEVEKAVVTEDDLYTTINEVRILVYGRTKGSSGEFSLCSGDYIFKDAGGTIPCTDGKVECKDGSPYRTADAYFIPKVAEKENYEYRLYALAYNKERWGDGENNGVKLKIDGKGLFYATQGIVEADQPVGNKTLEETGLSYMEILDTPTGCSNRLDFFAGSVGYDYGAGNLTEAETQMYENDYIDGSTSRKLAGKLYRATGRLSFHLTNINTDLSAQGGKYKSVRLLVSRYTTQSLIGLGQSWINHKYFEVHGGTEDLPRLYHVFGYGWNNQKGDPKDSDTWLIADEADMSTGTEATLYADCLPAHSFVVYIQPVYEDGTIAGTYRIHCAMKEYWPGYIGIVDKVADGEGLFSIVTNGWGRLSGEFNNLNNLKIDLGWGDDYSGPVLGEE